MEPAAKKQRLDGQQGQQQQKRKKAPTPEMKVRFQPHMHVCQLNAGDLQGICSGLACTAGVRLSQLLTRTPPALDRP